MGVEIRVPSLGESVSEATVARWFKQIGDPVIEDEPIVELETDKVTLEFNAPASGTLAEILVEEGGDVEVGALLGSIDQGDGAVAGEARAAQADTEAPDRGEGFLSPAVRRLIDEHGLDPASITATGPKGNLTKGDVLAAIEAGVPAARPEAVAQAEAKEAEAAAAEPTAPFLEPKPEPKQAPAAAGGSS
jgi:2-oxoglutarate dehydrogenase E2 component (dihydrolipoamide succinyltransferase)